jgi:hypothetical protein
VIAFGYKCDLVTRVFFLSVLSTSAHIPTERLSERHLHGFIFSYYHLSPHPFHHSAMNSSAEEAMLEELLGDLEDSCRKDTKSKRTPTPKRSLKTTSILSPSEEQAMLDCVLDYISDSYMSSPVKPTEVARKPLAPILLNLAPKVQSVKKSIPAAQKVGVTYLESYFQLHLAIYSKCLPSNLLQLAAKY